MTEGPFPESEEVGALERARARLYAPGAETNDLRQGGFGTQAQSALPHAWEPSVPKPQKVSARRHPHIRAVSLFFWSTLVFFFGAAGVAGYLLYFGGNNVSTNNIDLAIQGPAAISGGDTVPLAISITNRNPVAINNATIDIAFPEGTRSAENVLQEYTRYTERLGTIQAGETITRSVKAVLFGGEGQALSLPAAFSFDTQNSNATFVKRLAYALTVTASPLSLTVAGPKETVSGQAVTLTLALRSNATLPVGNVVLMAAYPFGFSLTSSSVPSQNGTFVLGTVRPGETKTIKISGTLTGSQNDQRTFHFAAGTAKSAQDPTLAISYLSQDTKVGITAPFIASALSVNGLRGEGAVLAPGSRSTVTLSYTNTLLVPVTNAEIAVRVEGGAVDYSSIQATRGFYRSLDHTVVFSKDNDTSLESLAPGASGLGTFTFATLGSAAVRDPAITFAISVSGTRVGQANVPENISASQIVNAKVASGAALRAYALHGSGPFVNSGSIPPRANATTTYTLIWSLQNAGNAIADATVTAVLPTYISFTGAVVPTGAVTFNEATRTVTWKAGDLAANASREAAFQVALVPSTSQKGTLPNLSGDATLAAYDRFAGVSISAIADAVTTATPSEAGYTSAQGVVQ